MRKNGFTLIETLIAVSIVCIAVVGPLVTASRSFVAAYTARDQLTAAYLAQEGVEYIRLMRDTMYLGDYEQYATDPSLAADAFCNFYNANPADPDTGCISSTGAIITPPATLSGASIATCLGPGDGSVACALLDPLAPMGTSNSVTTQALYLCGTLPCSTAGHLSISNGRYIYTGSNFTPFTRFITLYYPPGSSEIEIVSTVTWLEHGTVYKTVVTDYLSPWQ